MPNRLPIGDQVNIPIHALARVAHICHVAGLATSTTQQFHLHSQIALAYYGLCTPNNSTYIVEIGHCWENQDQIQPCIRVIPPLPLPCPTVHRRGRGGRGGVGVEFCGGGGAVGKAPLPVFSVSGHLLSPPQGQDLRWWPKISKYSHVCKILPLL